MYLCALREIVDINGLSKVLGHQNIFSTPWHGLFLSLGLFWGEEHHASKNYLHISCSDDGGGERSNRSLQNLP